MPGVFEVFTCNDVLAARSLLTVAWKVKVADPPAASRSIATVRAPSLNATLVAPVDVVIVRLPGTQVRPLGRTIVSKKSSAGAAGDPAFVTVKV